MAAGFGEGATVPDGQVAGVRRAQAERDPRVGPPGQAQRPERHRGGQVGADGLVYPHRLGDHFALRAAHLVQVAGQVDTA